ncbi:hypothetical protein B5X24_HaOG205339 [Helicoverpa armigera]|uniref:Tryptophan 5-hydroxylase 2 n=1 Tax=Helicoverpa armigera TaxID=29058 RepID=A0A2W1BRV1_HELAM|nr:hypothetical protein B5X24_HaOG205339 [Helicoverpa armigera]
MSGSGKGLLGLWLYRNGSEWEVKNEAHHHPKLGELNMAARQQTQPSECERISVIFTLRNQVGGLVQALTVFQDLGINVLHIESRKSVTEVSSSDILVDVECDPNRMEQLKRMLKREVQDFEVVSSHSAEEFPPPTPLSAAASFDFGEMHWFPRKISDLDRAQNVLMYGSELDADHPGFKDPVYRKRREQFAAIANSYKYGQPIPKVQYTDVEIKTWGIVFRELHKLYQKHACEEYLENWPQLVKYCGYREDNLPQVCNCDLYANYFLNRQ